MILNYTDSEVRDYHPLCERGLKKALEELKLCSKYAVLHHQVSGTLEMDFALQNTSTKKYLCVIEVKRTPQDVMSTRYQFQAKSYVESNSGNNERPYYMLTNLEKAYLFRYDKSLPRVQQQILEPGLINIGSFDLDEDVFFERMVNVFKNVIMQCIHDDSTYQISVDDLCEHINCIKKNKQQWNTDLAVICYEYIRGSLSQNGRRNELPDIRKYYGNLRNICSSGRKIDFNAIFDYSEDNFSNKITITASLLENIFKMGERNILGDPLANEIHQIISEGHEHEGEVPTDTELSRIVAILAKNQATSISDESFVCDPAAGSGNLISTIPNVFGIPLSRIKANEYKKELSQLISIRLGLMNSKTINPENAPQVTTNDITTLNKQYFENVEVVVMNPPFEAGINCTERKSKFFNAIYRADGVVALSDIGQMPLEVPFLELLLKLVKPGTTIALIFPKNHLLAMGPEAKITRSILIEKLGLNTIFTYPHKDIFEKVQKETCILIGTAQRPSSKVKIYSSYDNIPDIDLIAFKKALSKDLSLCFENISPGLVGRIIDTDELREEINGGWQILNSELADALAFVEKTLLNNDKLTLIKDSDISITRGTLGNKGCSDLLFIDPESELYKKYKCNIKTRTAIRNAGLNEISICKGDSEFIDPTINDSFVISSIVKEYCSIPLKGGRQSKKDKTESECLKILELSAKQQTHKNSVLLPRAIRKNGQVYLLRESAFVSTNFFICHCGDERQAILLSSWMSTVFYQLQCEVYSKDEKGMRKIEKPQMGETSIPRFDMVTEKTYNILRECVKAATFIDLHDPIIRRIDSVWAKELFDDAATSYLDDARDILSSLANRRSPP